MMTPYKSGLVTPESTLQAGHWNAAKVHFNLKTGWNNTLKEHKNRECLSCAALSFNPLKNKTRSGLYHCCSTIQS